MSAEGGGHAGVKFLTKYLQVVVVTPRIFITIPSGQSMEYGTMELPPRVIRQLVTQQVCSVFSALFLF